MSDAPIVLEIDGLSVVAVGRRLLAPSHIQLHEGERVLIVGPSGAGKSLLVDLLLGFAGPESPGLEVQGSVRLDGEEVLGRPADLRPGLGAVFQVHRPGLFDDLTIEENLRFGSLDRDREEAAAAAVSLEGLERPSATCSGGERIRVVLARTLLGGAEVLVFDEPTAGLDPGAVGQVVEAIRESHRRLTVVVTHDYDAFEGLADRILFLDPEQRRIVDVQNDAGAFDRLREALRTTPPPPLEVAPAVPDAMTRWRARLGRISDAAAIAVADLGVGLLAPVAWGRAAHPLDGPRVRRSLKRTLAPGVAAFVATSAMLIALTVTYFLFDRLPERAYTEALFLDDLLTGLGLVLTRVAVPLIASILLAAKLGASAAAHLGHMSLTRQIDALELLHVSPRRHLLLPTAGGQLAAAWMHTLIALLVAYATAMVVFIWAHPGWSAQFFHHAWCRELEPSDALWLAAKVGTSAVAVSAVAFRAGIAPKRSPEEVVGAIHRTLLRGLLWVLAIHAVFAFLEF